MEFSVLISTAFNFANQLLPNLSKNILFLKPNTHFYFAKFSPSTLFNFTKKSLYCFEMPHKMAENYTYLPFFKRNLQGNDFPLAKTLMGSLQLYYKSLYTG